MNTKHIILILLLIISGFSFNSCSDKYLDVTNPNQLTNDQFWKTEADVTSALTGTYSTIQLQLWDDQWGFNEGYFLNHESKSDLIDPQNLWDPFDLVGGYECYTSMYNIRRLWHMMYKGIFGANQVIANVPLMDLDQAKKDSFVAEAKFLRAYCHFLLLNDFHNIILLDKIPANPDEYIKAQSTPEEVYAFIEQDLKDAIADLPVSWPSEYLGRATKGAATAYLGKVYLFEKKWAEAEIELQNVVTSHTYSLVPGDNYTHLFDGTKEWSTESIFEINFTMREDGGRIESQSMVTNFTGTNQTISPNAYLKNLFMNDTTVSGTPSKRVFGSIVFNNPQSDIWYYHPNAGTNLSFTDYFGETSKVFWKKYSYHDYSSPRDENYSGINFILMRYADVLLMLAEAQNEQTKTADAVDNINLVRDRAGSVELPETMSQEAIRNHIRNVERPLELGNECGRFWDLVRWYSGAELKNILVSHGREKANQFDVNKDEYFPIPATELSANPLAKPNPGW